MLYEIRQLKKKYGSRTVLDIESLDIEAGKIYTLIGPNGAGKTTLLHLLAFLDRPSSGSLRYRDTMIRYGGRSLYPYRQKVVLVEQYLVLFHDLWHGYLLDQVICFCS